MRNWIVKTVMYTYSSFPEEGKPAMVLCDFERAIWVALSAVVPHAKVSISVDFPSYSVLVCYTLQFFMKVKENHEVFCI